MFSPSWIFSILHLFIFLHFPWRYVQAAKYLHDQIWTGHIHDSVSGPNFPWVLFSSSCHACDRNNLIEETFRFIVTSDTFHVHCLYIQPLTWVLLNVYVVFYSFCSVHIYFNALKFNVFKTDLCSKRSAMTEVPELTEEKGMFFIQV